MNKILTIFLLMSIAPINSAYCGEDMDGPVKYTLDLSQKYETYKLIAKDKEWAQRLVKKFKYDGDVIYFVRTTLSVKKNTKIINGSVYKSVGKKKYFYVTDSDAFLDLNRFDMISPGCGGFSVHYPKSRNFFIALNFNLCLGFARHSKITEGVNWWYGDSDINRFK